MYEILNELAGMLRENDIPFTPYGSDPEYIYYPQRMGYLLRAQQYEDSDYITIFTREDFVGNFHSVSEAYEIFVKKHFGKRKAVVDFVQEEIGRLKAMDSGCPRLSEHARNLNLMALEGKIFRAYGRDTEVEEILRIMLRKTKPNALLVGQAGCGKTAIVENLAFYITDSRIAYLRSKADNDRDKTLHKPTEELAVPLFFDTVIYDLDLTALTAGTKYRGEFEGKIRDILREVEKNPNIVVFIDEIHQINGMGSAEGSSGMGQLLKPALARGTIRCIGATTDDEAEIVYKDKALARRFNKMKILPLGGEVAINACAKILADYGKAHGITIHDVDPAYLFNVAQDKLKATAFPDNFINLVDETMATAKFKRNTEVTQEDFDRTVTRLMSADIVSVRVGRVGFDF